jgi:BirA family biotin operon repressor/biotin-[acetyl-CoA-carboxylase] ligase
MIYYHFMDFLIFQRCTSTNDLVLRLKNRKIGAILSYEQTKGRGQYDRAWESRRGGMYLSIPFYNCLPNTMELGKVVKNYLERICDVKFTLKPPNDILHNGKKLCGILVEARTRENKTSGVIGIGLNVRNDYDNAAKLGDFLSERIGIDIKKIAKEITCLVYRYLARPGQ